MKKVVLMSTIALSALSMMIISPVKAITKAPYWAHHEMELVDPGKQWVSEEGIVHVKDSYWWGSNEGSLGTGTLEVWYESLSLNPETGQGNCIMKLLVTIPDVGTMAGSGRGTITGGVFFSGTYTGTHGTGEFEGVKIMGSFEGVMPDPTHAIVDCVGTAMYP